MVPLSASTNAEELALTTTATVTNSQYSDYGFLLVGALGNVLTLLGNGPTNPRAAALVPQELRKNNPTDPENARVQVVLDGAWWGSNYQQANADFIDAVTG